jgi:hypothetical protein
MVMISSGNNAVHNVVGGEDVKNIENSRYKTRQGVWKLFTKSILNTEIIAAAMISIFGIILVAAATSSIFGIF